MDGNASAYAALGLYPDADPDQVERAYKRLIKRHHPDREGGDATRAAEINRAYRQLRGPPGQQQIAFAGSHPSSVGGRGWIAAALILVLVLALFLLATGPLTSLIRQLSPAGPLAPAQAAPYAHADAMDLPIHDPVVMRAVGDAARLLGRRDDAALLGASRDCHRLLRQRPSLAQLDRCAAFDDAVVVLQNRDPMWDRGPFSQLAVTGRQWSAAAAQSNDYLAVDGRLERIRLQVELALARAG